MFASAIASVFIDVTTILGSRVLSGIVCAYEGCIPFVGCRYDTVVSTMILTFTEALFASSANRRPTLPL